MFYGMFYGTVYDYNSHTHIIPTTPRYNQYQALSEASLVYIHCTDILRQLYESIDYLSLLEDCCPESASISLRFDEVMESLISVMDCIEDECFRHPRRVGRPMIKTEEEQISQGINVQRWRVRECIKRVDISGIHSRMSRVLRRRAYEVSSPNAVWHVDTYHKLIRLPFYVLLQTIKVGQCSRPFVML